MKRFLRLTGIAVFFILLLTNPKTKTNLSRLIQSQISQNEASDNRLPDLINRKNPVPTASPAIRSEMTIPIPTDTEVQKKPQVTENKENYVLEPCPGGEEDCYNLINVPYEKISTVQELNTAVNQYRINHGLNTLYIDPQICQIASQRAPELVTEFSHDRFSQHVSEGDYDFTGFSVIGENIWMGSMSGVHIVEYGWDRSPGHRENLQGNWSRGCAGIYDIYATFIFIK